MSVYTRKGWLSWKKIAGACFLLILGMVYIFPFLWMLSTSFKPANETLQFPPSLIPSEFTLSNYVYVFQSGPFVRFFLNSVIVTLSIVVIQLLVAIPAAYAFAKKKFKGSNLIYGVILSGLLIPVQVVILPIYLLFSKLGWINSYAALIVPFITSAFGIFLLTQTFKQVPEEILEAAKLDQASEFKVIRKIMLPMIKPTLITLILFTFISHWNDLFWPMVMTNSDTYRTLTVGMMRLRDMESQQWSILMAGNILLIAPVLVIYLFASSKIKTAFVYGGIK
ncbi:carbohydrate ABC transporter permease [Paenibacillus segetis]|uniref:Sugar ABC transporter permease n=1 Tax=Paenibacillus segetis TaxID=1325360 RepID=A0ABQ1YTK9_9BACL|nr:carbohydrate ABC transporter permease [Paenibacillus segetis]GGH36615.1 sugar ABC transporter permease [Paenibacillus segetis]